MAEKKKKKNFYVDNKKFYAEMVIFHEARQKDPKCRIPEYIGECIMLISKKLSFAPNFINYSFREEMVSDAIENCILYIHNFKPVLTSKDQNEAGRVKKSNPFSYFTQYAYNAFLRRIEKEKKLLRLKSKYVQNMDVLDEVFGDNVIVSTQGHDSNDGYTQEAGNMLRYYYDYDISQPKKDIPPKKSKKQKNIDKTDILRNFS